MNTFKKKLKNFYSNLRLQSKLMISHLVLVILPTIVISYFFYGQLYGIIVSETIRQEQGFSKHSSINLNSAINSIKNAANTLFTHPYLNDLFASPDSISLSGFYHSAQTNDFYVFANSLIDKNLITDIAVYADFELTNLYNPYKSYPPLFHPLDDIRGAYWHGIFSSSDITSLYCPEYYLAPSEIKKYDSLSLIQKVSYTYNGAEKAAYIVFYISQDHIDSLLMQDISENNTVSYVINNRDSIVAASDHSLASLYIMKYDDIQESFMSSNNYISINVLNEDIYAGFYSLDDTDWFMVSILPSESLEQKGNILILQFVIVYLLFLIIAFILATTLSRSITKRLGDVIAQMKTVHCGRPVPMVTSQIHDEVGDLIDTYNYMSNEMSLLMDKEVQAVNAIRLSEFKALQSQINPHFLYNTLDMVNWLIKSHQDDKANDAVLSISKFYKLTLNKGNTATSIEEELTQVSLYVKLQNMRFEDKINYIVDVPDELLTYEIPKLILQPIVENAIMHGLLEKEEGEGTIVITAWLEDENLVFLISDDGVGISKEKVGTILKGEGESSTGSNIGIRNTHTRLQLFYGDNFGLEYNSTLEAGTEVQITIPAKNPTIN